VIDKGTSSRRLDTYVFGLSSADGERQKKKRGNERIDRDMGTTLHHLTSRRRLEEGLYLQGEIGEGETREGRPPIYSLSNKFKRLKNGRVLAQESLRSKRSSGEERRVSIMSWCLLM